jgi:hypothetical protein
MPLVIIINVVIVVTLVFVSVRKGVEEALPYWAFFAVLLPQEARISLAGAFDLSSTRLALVTLFALFLMYRPKISARQLPLKNHIWVHVGWVMFSTLFSIVFTASVKQLLAQLLEYYLLYYILINAITKVGTITRIMYAMVIAMAVCSVLGLLEIYSGWTVVSIFPTELQKNYGASALYAENFDRGVRARSTFPHPIHFGGALAMTIPFTLYLVSTSSAMLKKVGLNVALLLMFWALYKTGSRGPWIATATAIGILAVAAEPRIRKRIFAGVALAGLLLVCRPGILETLVNMYLATMDTNSMMGSSFEYRPVLFHTVTKTLNSDIMRGFLGFGLESFRDKGLILEMPGIETHRWYTCDSTWILFAYESGYVGLIILGSLLLRPAAMAYRSFRGLSKPDRHFSLIVLSSLVSFYVVMISVSIYGWGQNGYMLWTVISVSIAYTLLKTAEADDGGVSNPTDEIDAGSELKHEFALASGQDRWFQQQVNQSDQTEAH